MRMRDWLILSAENGMCGENEDREDEL